MLKWCNNCSDEVEVKHGLCVECGEEFYTKRKRKEDWEDDEWTETEWDQFYKYERGR